MRLGRGSQTERVSTILRMLIERRNGLSVNDVEEEFECSDKTARRYLEALEYSGWPIMVIQKKDADNCRRRYWKLTPEWKQQFKERP